MNSPTIHVDQHIGTAGAGAKITGVELVVHGLDRLPTRYDGRVKNILEYYVGAWGQPAPFGGRQADLAALDAWLADPAAPHYAALIAPAGRGKSALLAHWVTRIAGHPDDIHVVYFPISVRFNTNLESVALAALAARAAYVYGEQVTHAFDAQQYRGVFGDTLRRPPPDGRPVLVVLDGLNEAAWEVWADLFPHMPPDHLRVVVAARPLAGDVGAGGWLRRLGWDAPGRAYTPQLDGLDLAGVSDVLAQMGNPLDTLAARVDVVKKLHELSAGDPLLVRLYVEALTQQGERAALLGPEDLETLQPGLEQQVAARSGQHQDAAGNTVEQEPVGGSTYHIHIEQASSLAIGDGARVVQGSARDAEAAASLRHELAEAEANLALIRERKAQYVLEVDVPLQLVKEERRLLARIAELKARLGE